MKRRDGNGGSGIVFSTNREFMNTVMNAETEEIETLPPARQRLRLHLERAGRGGKSVTLVSGFVGRSDDLKALGQWLRSRLGLGGSCKDGDIVLQGDVRARIIALLKEAGYKDVK